LAVSMTGANAFLSLGLAAPGYNPCYNGQAVAVVFAPPAPNVAILPSPWWGAWLAPAPQWWSPGWNNSWGPCPFEYPGCGPGPSKRWEWCDGRKVPAGSYCPSPPMVGAGWQWCNGRRIHAGTRCEAASLPPVATGAGMVPCHGRMIHAGTACEPLPSPLPRPIAPMPGEGKVMCNGRLVHAGTLCDPPSSVRRLPAHGLPPRQGRPGGRLIGHPL